MWGLLRIILLVGNAVFFATLVYVAMDKHLPDQWEDLLFYGMMTWFPLNFVYLLLELAARWKK